MGIAHFLDIFDHFLRDGNIVVEFTAVTHFPGTKMHLIDIHRRTVRNRFRTLGKPFFVMPFVAVDIVDLGPGRRPCFHMKTEGIAI